MVARRLAALLALAALALSATACAGVVKPLDYQTANERSGPGIISGPSGKFVIYGGG